MFDAIPGPEQINAELFCESGAAVFAENSNEAAKLIINLLTHKEKLKEMRQNSARLAKTKAAAQIVRFALEKSGEEVNERKFLSVGV